MKKILIGTTLFAALMSTAALAGPVDDNRVGIVGSVVDYDAGDITEFGVKFEGVQNDFDYVATLGSGDAEGDDFKSVYGKLAWTPFGENEAFKVGPVLSYQALDFDDSATEDAVFAGVAVRSETGSMALTADLMGDVDNLDDNWAASIGAEYDLTNNFILVGDYTFNEFDGDESAHQVRAGGRYNFSQTMYGEAGLLLTDIADENGDGAYLGAGFRF